MDNLIKHQTIELSRDNIIFCLRDYFFDVQYVQACWLGGSDANDEIDGYSDIDIYFSVGDKDIESFYQAVAGVLTQLGMLDYVSEIITEENQIGQLYHIAGTNNNMLIEVWCISSSQKMIFEEGHPAFKPKILFDRGNTIEFKPFQQSDLQTCIGKHLAKQKDLVLGYGRRDAYIQRGNYIEATNYYMKFTFIPLVEVLRIKYTPRLFGWGRIHISRHFPQGIVVRLEQLMYFGSIYDIKTNTQLAQEWFWEVVEEVEK